MIAQSVDADVPDINVIAQKADPEESRRIQNGEKNDRKDKGAL